MIANVLNMFQHYLQTVCDSSVIFSPRDNLTVTSMLVTDGGDKFGMVMTSHVTNIGS